MLTTICNNVYPLTLLSPARDIATAKAAIQAGADAIYIGAARFGARHAAGNSLDDIAELVRYANPYGVKILVTLNTLLTDEERPEAVAMAWQLYEAGVYALIIQDLTLLNENLPPIRLHASTQCDNRTPEQVAHLRDLGFKCVVLARELSIDEIRAIHAAVPDIELEAFVHGALCVSYSGRCYMSEDLLGRSANRGCCAQLCRLRYDLLDENSDLVLDDHGQPIEQRYLLSLQDMDRSMYLGELIDAGVTTFKIEGRLKDADYVTNVTAFYRDAIDNLTASYACGHVYKRTFVPSPAKTFHRGSIDYFLHGRTPHMANFDTPKSTGEHIGELLEVRGNMLRVRLLPGVVLHNGDGLTIAGEGFSVNGIDGSWIKINKDLTLTAEAGLTAAGVPTAAGGLTGASHRSYSASGLTGQRPVTCLHVPLYRNQDVEFLKSLHSERRIPVDIVLEDTPTGFRLTIGDRSAEFTADKQLADNADRAMDTIRRQLSKLGDTIYTVRNLTLRLTKPYFIPISQLNQWRRDVLALPQKETPTANGGPTGAPHRSYNEVVVQRSGHLMECRYCLLFELGHCRKANPYPKGKEPRYLRMPNGTVVRLHFDCHNCQMLIYKQ